MENDTALVGLGEATVGAGKGAAIVVYVTISTGANGARIVDGVLDRAAFGFELGEQLLGRAASAGTLEELVSGRAIQDRFGAPPATLGKDSAGDLGVCRRRMQDRSAPASPRPPPRYGHSAPEGDRRAQRGSVANFYSGSAWVTLTGGAGAE